MSAALSLENPQVERVVPAGTRLPALKQCSCGLAYITIPGAAAVSKSGDLYFQCKCESTLTIRQGGLFV